MTGIAYNADVTGEVKSFEELLSRPELKGRITLLTEMRDTMTFMLKVVGADPGAFDDDDWANAIDRLRQVVADGQVRAVHRQRLHPGPRRRQHRRLRGVVG